MLYGNTSFANRVIDLLVDRRAIWAGLIAMVSLCMALLAFRIEIDPNLETVYDPNSPEYEIYQRFVEAFGNDEYVFIALENSTKVTDSRILAPLASLTQDLQKLEKVTRVESIATLGFPGKRNGVLDIYPLVGNMDGQPVLDEHELEAFRSHWPSLDMFVSRDLETVGVAAYIVNELTFGPWTEKLLKEIEAAVRKRFPDNTELHMIGMPVMKVALQKYTLETARIFGLVSALIASLISVYIFKRLWVLLAGAVVGGLSVLWILGMMVLIDIRLNMSTSVCFGIVFILTIPTVIHTVSHFNRQYLKLGIRTESVKSALRLVGRPCLMCSVTTAFGFASIMLSPIPSIAQMGMILSLGILVSFALTIMLMPTLLMRVPLLNKRDYDRMSRDGLTTLFMWVGRFVFSHGRGLFATVLLIIGVMALGIQYIKVDEPVTHMLSRWTTEAQDILFVEKTLMPVSKVSILVEGAEGDFKQAGPWMKVRLLETRLSEIPEVRRMESLLPLMENINASMGGRDLEGNDLFSTKERIPQLLDMVSWSVDGRRSLSRHVSGDYSQLHLAVTLTVQPETHLVAVIGRIQAVTQTELAGLGDVHVTGHLALGAAQATTLIRTQTISLLLALSVITLLITIQLRSIPLGLISIIPNVVPLVVIFGAMGWFGIYLDSLTIFVAVVSYGLSVDDTIHYLTQLKREINYGPPSNPLVEKMQRAYLVTGKALMSTSAVLCLSFLALSFAPFQPVVSFGLLAALAVFAALAGDIVLLPALAISSSFIRKVIKKSASVKVVKPEVVT